jgi:hypothetical protein
MPQETATDTPRDPYSYIEFEFRTIICFTGLWYLLWIPDERVSYLLCTEDKIPSLACTADFATSGGGRICRRPNRPATATTRSGAAASFLYDWDLQNEFRIRGHQFIPTTDHCVEQHRFWTSPTTIASKSETQTPTLANLLSINLVFLFRCSSFSLHRYSYISLLFISRFIDS